MTFLPIAERELRIRARRPGTFALRCIAATLAVGLSGMLLILAALPRPTGSGPFAFLVFLTFVYCLYEGLRNTADCLSEEKRAGTLGFLFLTDLKGYDVVFGKLFATSLSGFYGLIAILPALGLPLLVGGVTAGEFWRAVLVLIVTLFFSLSTGMVVSSASRSERRAWGISLAIVGFLAIVPPLLRWIPVFQINALNWISPGVALVMIDEASYAARPVTFWGAVGGVHLLSWLFLATASIVLPRAWQQRDVVCVKRTVLPTSVAKRKPLLEQNPIVWLVSREDRIKVYVWALVAVVAAGFLAVWTATGFSSAVLAGFVACLFVVHFLIAGRVAFHVCHAFVDARDSGLLQLLLATPLSSTQILDGYREAFKRLFGGPVILLLWFEAAIIGTHFLLSKPGEDLWLGAILLLATAILATAFVMDLYAVTTFGMWVSLKAKKPSHAFNKTALMVLILPIGVGMFCCSVAYPILAIIKNLVFFSYRTPLYRDFRRIIGERESSSVLGPK